MVRSLRVGVNGASGRMGSVTTAGLQGRQDLELVFTADKGDDLHKAIRETEARVVVDFTVPEAVFRNTLTIIEAGASPVVGTTGLSEAELATIEAGLLERDLGGFVIPNFSIGALLMTKLAKVVARHMDACEIIELHHEQKMDSPSGTSLLTADRVAEALHHEAESQEKEPISRGMQKGAVRIHSIRLPGLMAHQQVIFGSRGETLTLSHNAISRDCFLPGILRAIREVVLIKGLEQDLKI